MDHPLFETPRPDLTAAEAERLVAGIYGVDGRAVPLAGERDQNFEIAADSARYVLRVGNVADDPAAVEMQSLAMVHVRRADPGIPIPDVVRTVDGALSGSHSSAQGAHPTQLTTFMPGVSAENAPSTPEFCRAIGSAVGRLSRALSGFDHLTLRRHLLWDLSRLEELASFVEHLPGDRRRVIEAHLAKHADEVAPALRSLPHQAVYGDTHAGNLLVDPLDPERITGLFDFGDLTHGPRVMEPAIAAAYQVFGADPAAALVHVTSAFHAQQPLSAEEVELIPRLALARLVQSHLISAWRVVLHPENRDYILSDSEDSWRAIEALATVDLGAVVEAIQRACGRRSAARRPLDDALALRRARLGPALSLSYDVPVRLASGEGVWLTDVDGTRLLDAYNNVPHVGHGHPEVANAVASQVHRLATNTRYLVDEVTEYADRLAVLMPGDLSVVMFVNSGSEANDVAYQIARTVTGRRGVVVTEHAYHGTTFATSSMSPEEIPWNAIEGWVTHVGGAETLRSADAATRIGPELATAFGELESRGEAPAMVIFDNVFSSDGIHSVPPGYLAEAYRVARAHGAICVADEVQAGFGRVGSEFWGFALDGVTPDIVTLGKPMGNGHPMGAVVTTPAIAAEFAKGWHFFSTFAGSPVAAVAGSAVLDVLEREDLPARADAVGAHLRRRIGALRHPSIVDIRGPGMFTGVEVDTADRAGVIVEGLRARGVLIGRTGAVGTVLKIRPPLVFSERHADLLVDHLAAVLSQL